MVRTSGADFVVNASLEPGTGELSNNHLISEPLWTRSTATQNEGVTIASLKGFRNLSSIRGNFFDHSVYWDLDA